MCNVFMAAARDASCVGEAGAGGEEDRARIEGVLKMMEEGRLFTGYFEYQGRAVKQDFTVVYRPRPWPGALYWCEPGKVVESGDCCLSLTMVEDVYLGKHTKIFLSEMAGDAPADRCFSIFSKDNTHINFEAGSAEQRTTWVQGITHILTNSGMKIIESMQEVQARGKSDKSDKADKADKADRAEGAYSSSDSEDDRRAKQARSSSSSVGKSIKSGGRHTSRKKSSSRQSGT